MIQHTLTIRLSWHVSEAMLPDLRALLPAEAIQFFTNDLDEQWHHTLLCIQSEESCALIVSALMLWRLLGRITSLQYSSSIATRDISASDQRELFELLQQPGALLNVA
ncbi:hypothetical protein [Erwinia sp. V71]|uniref:hypothetical protein n=1 Tax=Erwinia sp. V71 TaxID=3369424 RepID=UPI003F61AA2F